MPCMRNSRISSAGKQFHMKYLLFLLTLTAGTLMAVAQRTATVTAAYTYYAPESMSVEEARHIALHRAQTEAIAAEFGTTVTQVNTVVTANTNTETDSRLYSVGGSEVKGEWIQTISEPVYTVTYDKGVLTVGVTVRGLIREMDLTAPEIEIRTYRNGLGANNEAEAFRDGDDFFMTARASVDGYLVAYLLDEKTRKAYRILPYQQARESSVRLKEGQQATFFSTEGADAVTRASIDTYTLTCEEPVEFNRLYVIYSDRPVSISTAESRSDADVPFELDERRFHDWLLKRRSTAGVRVVERPLKISAR